MSRATDAVRLLAERLEEGEPSRHSEIVAEVVKEVEEDEQAQQRGTFVLVAVGLVAFLLGDVYGLTVV